MLKTNKYLQFIPNILTLLNASCGIIAITISVFHGEIYDVRQSTVRACYLIALGAFFDCFDGKLARKFEVTSLIGKELDSFADAITFVIAPTYVFLAMHTEVKSYIVFVEVIIMTFYIMCGVYRLARYNVTEFKPYFEGMPTTLVGFIFSFYIFISAYTVKMWHDSALYTVVSYGLIIFLGVAMVSTVKVKRI